MKPPAATPTGHEQRAGWHAYCHDRAQRRQDAVAAAAREAGERAPDPITRVKDGQAARLRAEVAFDEFEPALSYDEFKATTA